MQHGLVAPALDPVSVPVLPRPQPAMRIFKPNDTVLAYHGQLLYEAAVIQVKPHSNGRTTYVITYQGWMKSWNAEVDASVVFEHNDVNLRIAHGLLRDAKIRQSFNTSATHLAHQHQRVEMLHNPIPISATVAPSPLVAPSPVGPPVVTASPVGAPVGTPIGTPRDASVGTPVRPPVGTPVGNAVGTPIAASTVAATAIDPHASPIHRADGEQYPGMLDRPVTNIPTATTPSIHHPRTPITPIRPTATAPVPAPSTLDGLPGATIATPTSASTPKVGSAIPTMNNTPATTHSPARTGFDTPNQDGPIVQNTINEAHAEDLDEHVGAMMFQIPSTLKQQLIDDWEFVTKEQRLVPLPRTPNVEVIIQSWLEQRQHLDRGEFAACQEVGDGVRTYFDAALPNMLLYKFERHQYNEYFGSNGQGAGDHKPSRHYGAEHLARILLKIPYILEEAQLDRNMLGRIAEKFNDLAGFIARYGRNFFINVYEPASPEYVDKAANAPITPSPTPSDQDRDFDRDSERGFDLTSNTPTKNSDRPDDSPHFAQGSPDSSHARRSTSPRDDSLHFPQGSPNSPSLRRSTPPSLNPENNINGTSPMDISPPSSQSPDTTPNMNLNQSTP